LFSSRYAEEIIYHSELDAFAAAGDGFEVIHTLTRSRPPGWTGYDRRIDDRMLAEVLEPLGVTARTYICGPTALVEVAANALVRLGLPPDRVRTERFGPTGT
jgi:ferredoxin-NADP reductase